MSSAKGTTAGGQMLLPFDGGGTSTLTDDEILGITSPGRSEASKSSRQRKEKPAVQAADGADGSSTQQNFWETDAAKPDGSADSAANATGNNAQHKEGQNDGAYDNTPEELKPLLATHPALKQAWENEREYRELFPSLEAAREIHSLFPTVEDAKAAEEQLSELRKLDALFFSNQPEAHAALAAHVHRLNPLAFRGLVRMMNAVLAPGDQGADTKEAASNSASGAPGTEMRASKQIPRASAGGQDAAPGGASRNAALLHEANASAVQTIVEDIKAQVERLLPPEIAQGARNRVIGEIYREVDGSLRSNHALGQQMRQALHSGGLNAEQLRGLVSLVVGRARQALPGAARKVVSEWTTGVLKAQQVRHSRQRAGENRVDLMGAGRAESSRKRPVAPKDIDYGRMSDGEILDL